MKELPTMKASGKRREENQLRRGTIYSSDWSSRREADRRELPTGWRSHLRQEGQHPARGREGGTQRASEPARSSVQLDIRNVHTAPQPDTAPHPRDGRSEDRPDLVLAQTRQHAGQAELSQLLLRGTPRPREDTADSDVRM